jgi:hypothetical protein
MHSDLLVVADQFGLSAATLYAKDEIELDRHFLVNCRLFNAQARLPVALNRDGLFVHQNFNPVVVTYSHEPLVPMDLNLLIVRDVFGPSFTALDD